MNPKVFFVIVGLLIVLTVVGIGAGALQGGDDPAPLATPAWGDGIREALEQPLSSDDVQTAFPSQCRNQLEQGTFLLVQGGRCTLIIRQSRANVRTLTLVLTEGTGVTVEINPAGEGRFKSTQTLETGGNMSQDAGEVKLSIFREGGAVEIRCAAGPCRLVVTQ
jgi:hypothetical protein